MTKLWRILRIEELAHCLYKLLFVIDVTRAALMNTRSAYLCLRSLKGVHRRWEVAMRRGEPFWTIGEARVRNYRECYRYSRYWLWGTSPLGYTHLEESEEEEAPTHTESEDDEDRLSLSSESGPLMWWSHWCCLLLEQFWTHELRANPRVHRFIFKGLHSVFGVPQPIAFTTVAVGGVWSAQSSSDDFLSPSASSAESSSDDLSPCASGNMTCQWNLDFDLQIKISTSKSRFRHPNPDFDFQIQISTSESRIRPPNLDLDFSSGSSSSRSSSSGGRSSRSRSRSRRHNVLSRSWYSQHCILNTTLFVRNVEVHAVLMRYWNLQSAGLIRVEVSWVGLKWLWSVGKYDLESYIVFEA